MKAKHLIPAFLALAIILVSAGLYGAHKMNACVDRQVPFRTLESQGYSDAGFIPPASWQYSPGNDRMCGNHPGCGMGEAAFDMRVTNSAGRRANVLVCCRSGGMVGQTSCEIRGK